MSGQLLEPALLARLEALQMKTRHRVAGLFPGEHRSARHGGSPDFADYREYNPGDDFRRIDYNLYARLDVLLVKLFEASDEVQVRILIDTSASMGVWDKLAQAKRIAAAAGFVALVARDPVSLHSFPFSGPAPRFVGRAAVPALFSAIGALDASGPTTLASAASHLLAQAGPAGMTFLVSDLLTPEWEAALARLPVRGGDLVVVHVLARDELEPDLVGDVDLRDRETGERLAVSLASETVGRYRRHAEAWADRVASSARASGCVYLRVLASDDVQDVLLGSLRRAEVWR